MQVSGFINQILFRAYHHKFSLEGWDWSLLTFSQSVTFSKSELRSLASLTESFEVGKIWVSSAYKHGVVFLRQFGKSLI